MIIKYWTESQLSEIAKLVETNLFPQEVGDEIKRVAKIMDKYYDSERNAESDDGGIICLILPADNKACKATYDILLDRYYVKADDVEFHDTLCQDASAEWFSDLFMVNSEFALTIIYPHRKGA